MSEKNHPATVTHEFSVELTSLVAMSLIQARIDGTAEIVYDGDMTRAYREIGELATAMLEAGAEAWTGEAGLVNIPRNHVAATAVRNHA